MKLKGTTLSSDTKIHHWGVGYGDNSWDLFDEDTVGMGNGPENPYTNIVIGKVNQLVPGDLQILRNLEDEQKKTLLLITGILLTMLTQAQILLLICQEEIFLGDTIQIIVGTYLMRTLMR